MHKPLLYSSNLIWLFLLCLCEVSPAWAQVNPEDKLSVAVLPFTSSNIVKPEDLEAIYGQVTTAFVNARRFSIIERKNHEAIFKELEQQKQEIYMNSTNLAKQGAQLGANYLVLGEVGAGSSNNAIALILKLVDVETSEIVASKNISSTNSGTTKVLNSVFSTVLVGDKLKNGDRNQIDQGVASAGKTMIDNLSVNTLDIGKEVKEFITEYFPLNSKIIGIEEQKGSSAEKVLIAIGEGMSLKKGQTLYVYEETILEAGGKKLRRKTELGKIKIDSIEGAVSVCKVSEGGAVILKKHTGNGVYVSTNKSK